MSTQRRYRQDVGNPAQSIDDRQMTVWRTFFEMQEVLRGRLEAQLQADSGLSNADYTVLVALSESPKDGLRAVDLGQRLCWEKSRLHHQLSRMTARGLVQRRNGPGRSVFAQITRAGRSALQAAVPGHSREVRRLFLDRLTSRQIGQLGEISRKILDGLREV